MERPLARLEPMHRAGFGTRRARFDGKRFRSSLRFHVRRWRWVYLLVASVAFAFHARYTIGLNVTASLPYRLFVIDKADHPDRSQFVAFRWPGGGPYAKGAIFVKQVVGISGDIVTRVNRSFFVNGHPVGLAKPMSQSGRSLALGPAGTLPTDRYYVRAPHPDSLDSRYALLGWIAESQIIGRAYVVF